MNAVGIALMWCVAQITLMGLSAAGLYLVVRRFRPAAASQVALAGLVTVIVLSAFALSPWPRWITPNLISDGAQPHGAQPPSAVQGRQSRPGAAVPHPTRPVRAAI